ncbi:MAG: flagellar protein FlgN [Sphingomonadales bacterium]|nr:flagellar protein FlgN [Sphingomonadales bacterium]
MVAVLQSERHSLAGMDLDGIMGAASDKVTLCGHLEVVSPDEIDDECRGLLDAAKRLNEVNRQLRNLIAANVSARLEALTGSPNAYGARGGMTSPAYAYAGVRA